MPPPNFIIIGETKCGTTSMYDNLIQHPHILPSKGNGDHTVTEDDFELGIKETRFFDKNWYRGWDWYKSCFPECPQGYITGEASPTYLYRIQALERIGNLLQDCKIIIMLRDPVSRLVSHYNHLKKILPIWHKRYKTLYDFWTSAAEPDYYIIDKGIYWRSVQEAFRCLNRQNIIIIKSEMLFEEPQRVYNTILDFLNMTPYILTAPSHSRKNIYSTPDIGLLKEIESFYKPHNDILAEMLGEKFW